MPKIHPGHEVLSLFGSAFGSQALNQKAINPRLVTSLVSAFLIILAVSLVLGFVSRSLGGVQQTASAAASVEQEKTAFTPGQFVSAEISRGYLGK